jgi:hypothetical protein
MNLTCIKSFFFLTLLSSSFSLLAQKDTRTTSFIISGDVVSPVTITLDDLGKLEETQIGDVIITNHLGEKKSVQKALRGVLLKDALQTIEIKSESPKVLSEYYFVCKAADSYTVVYSWNEIFNSPTGDSVFIVTSLEGKVLKEMEESILMISPNDFKTGRRFVKSLTSIEVKRAK